MRRIEVGIQDTYRGSLILVAPGFPMRYEPEEHTAEPALESRPDIKLEEQAAAALKRLLKNIHAKEEIVPVSGLRTRREQELIWEESEAENGLAFTRKYVAVPGHSEHQTGLAVDLAENKADIDFIRPELPYTGIFCRFRRMAPRFGFTERYLAGKEEITGIGAEPWHFRYVGAPHAVIMAEKKMVLEEYIEFLKLCTSSDKPYIYEEHGRTVQICYVPVAGKTVIEFPAEDTNMWSISGTNEGGIIISIYNGGKKRR